MKAPHRFSTLDGMRGIAALAVMLHHFTQHTSFRAFSGSSLAVDLFFCLSGFVIAHSYLNRLKETISFGGFMLRRAVRLYPMFLCGLGLGSLSLLLKVANLQSSLNAYQAIQAILLNALCLPYISDFYIQVGNSKIASALFPTNDATWSLFFELTINVVFGAIASRARRWHFAALSLLGAIGLVIYVKLTWDSSPGWSAHNVVAGVPRVMFGFFAGVSLCLIFERTRSVIPAVNPLYLAALVIAILSTRWTSQIWLAFVLFLVPAIVAMGSVSAPRTAIAGRVFEYLGWISYPVYCIHFPVYSIYTLLTGNADHGVIAALVCTPVAVTLAHLLGKWIDEPARASLSQRLLPSRRNISTQSV